MTRLRQPAFVWQQPDYGESRGYGVAGEIRMTKQKLSNPFVSFVCFVGRNFAASESLIYLTTNEHE
jgi:hypothetical protein